jgi:hypothetical protein
MHLSTHLRAWCIFVGELAPLFLLRNVISGSTQVASEEGGMTRNVLLMFSTDQPPDPVEEMRWHAKQCAADGTTAVVTRRVLNGLTADRSSVAFYGNQALDNRYLGRGTFVEYIPLGTDRGREIARESPLYGQRGMPGSARGFMLVKELHLATEGEDLSSLGGKIEASGRTLTREALPAGRSRAQVYYE